MLILKNERIIKLTSCYETQGQDTGYIRQCFLTICTARWESRKDEDNYSTSHGVRPSCVLAQVITGCVCAVIDHMWCPCLYCLANSYVNVFRCNHHFNLNYWPWFRTNTHCTSLFHVIQCKDDITGQLKLPVRVGVETTTFWTVATDDDKVFPIQPLKPK